MESVVLDPTKAAFDSTASVNDLGATHFIGIGGAGMSVLAEMLNAQGVKVDGSDRERSVKTDRLEELGITVEFGQREENVAGAKTVVYSSAIKPENPEIVAAASAGAHIVHRSDILALLMNGKRAVTVAGAHGKTTTSSMLAHILVNAGTGELADPSYAIGGSIQTPDGGAVDGGHAGAGVALVAEADESDGSFAKYRPYIAIVTNAEPDHLDHYGDAEHYHAAFVNHLSHAQGYAVVCADDDDARTLLAGLSAEAASKAVAYGTASVDDLGDLQVAAYVPITNEAEQHGTEQFHIELPETVTGGAARSLDVALKVPGTHNARNATAAIIAAALLGVDAEAAAEAAGSFLGAARRFQLRGEVGGVTVIDDYAHHPTEIAALLDAARRRYPEATIHALFQPHLFSRTKFFADEFAQALAKADDVIVAGIYPAREKQADFPDVSAATIVERAKGMKQNDDWIQAVDDMHTAAQMMAMRASSGDVIFTVGAGDITDMGPAMVQVLQARGEGVANG